MVSVLIGCLSWPAAGTLAALLAWGCGSSEIRDADPVGGSASAGANRPDRGGERAAALDFGVEDDPAGDVGAVCAAHVVASELRPVSLAFVYDVSGSMGGGDRARFERKWLPVVAASKAFFAAPEAVALSASLTFFPKERAETRCTPEAYESADVPELALPSPAFAQAIDDLDYTLGSDNWRSSTPTLAAFTGTATRLLDEEDGTSTARAIVMVTDGVPQGCDGADDVELVARAVRERGIQTFVVGVANPPGDDAGDNLANLNVIAQAGGTERAFIVATGDPARTEADFRAVIERIRGLALACKIEIPTPPTGSTFVPDQVNVSYASASSQEIGLNYDPACTAPRTWRYDDPTSPATIVLCSETCDRVQQDTSARLSVEFGCTRRLVPR